MVERRLDLPRCSPSDADFMDIIRAQSAPRFGCMGRAGVGLPTPARLSRCRMPAAFTGSLSLQILCWLLSRSQWSLPNRRFLRARWRRRHVATARSICVAAYSLRHNHRTSWLLVVAWFGPTFWTGSGTGESELWSSHHFCEFARLCGGHGVGFLPMTKWRRIGGNHGGQNSLLRAKLCPVRRSRLENITSGRNLIQLE